MVQRIGIDVGYGFVKALMGDHQVMFPSVISPMDTLNLGTISAATDPNSFVIRLSDGELSEGFRVGDDAIRQGYATRATLHSSRTRSREMAVLFSAALALLLKDGCDPLNPEVAEVYVVTGLPVRDYADREWLQQAFQTRHEIDINGKMVTVEVQRLTVIPQPFGSYFDLAVRPDGADPRFSSGLIGVIDVGYLTTDFIAVHDRQYVPKLSGGLSEGMSTVYRRCAQILAGQYRVEVNESTVASMLRNGVRVMGVTHPIDPQLVAHVFTDFAETLRSQIFSLWGKEALNVLVLAGGGGAALESHLRGHFPQLVLPHDPQWANVRGYLKFCNFLRP